MEQKELQPEWHWWDGLLRTGDFPEPLQDGVVHYGYYRRSSDKKGANARWIPIGIWGTPKGIVCEVDGKRVADISKAPWRPFDLLFHKSLQAVSHETYMAVTRQKAPWPDAPPVLEGPDPTPQPPLAPTPPDLQYDAETGDWREVQRLAATGASVPAADRAVDRHHNEPPDEHRILYDRRAQLDEEQLLVAKRLQKPITNQDEANSVSEHANRIALLAKWFEGEYEQRNRPILEQQKVLRVDYLHPAQEANSLAKTLTQHTAAFLLAEQKKLEEEQRRAAEEAAAKGELEIDRPGAPPPPKRAGAGGLTGRRTTVKEEAIGIVEDYMEFAGVLIRGQLANPPPGYCGSPELKNFLDARASAMAKKLPPDHTISGVRIEKQPKARR